MICKNDSRAEWREVSLHLTTREGVRVRVRVGLQRVVVCEKLTNVISQMSHPAKKHFKLACLRESLRFPFPTKTAVLQASVHAWFSMGPPRVFRFQEGATPPPSWSWERCRRSYGFTGHPSSTEPDA